MFCQNCGHEIAPGSVVCLNCGNPVQNNVTFCMCCGAQLIHGAAICTRCGTPTNAYSTPNYTNQKSKIVAGLLAILIGSLGIHNFYLGNTGKGTAQLLLTLLGTFFTCGISAIVVYIWSIVEGIQILTGSINTDANGVPLSD